MLVDDFVCSQWELMRLRRLRDGVMEECGHRALRAFLREAGKDLDWELEFEVLVADSLEEHFPEAEAKELARQYVLSESNAVDKVDELFSTELLLDQAQFNKAERARTRLRPARARGCEAGQRASGLARHDCRQTLFWGTHWQRSEPKRVPRHD